jgi:hypothetical protein
MYGLACGCHAYCSSLELVIITGTTTVAAEASVGYAARANEVRPALPCCWAHTAADQLDGSTRRGGASVSGGRRINCNATAALLPVAPHESARRADGGGDARGGGG